MFRSELEQRVAAAEDAVRAVVAGLDPDEIPAREAARVFERLDQIVRTATAGRTLLARRVEDSLEWKRTGHRSALARRSAGADQPAADARRGRPPEHLALLRLDVEALWRGHVEGDELCEVTGLGPIPVAIARRLLGDAVLKLVLTKGEAVASVTSLTRGPTQAMRYALLWTSPTCTVEGCARTIVEHDHAWGAEYRDTCHTRLDELERVCDPHHDLHTYEGWALVAGTGKRPMVPPDHPLHPANAQPGPRHDAANARPPNGPAPPESSTASPSTAYQADLFAAIPG